MIEIIRKAKASESLQNSYKKYGDKWIEPSFDFNKLLDLYYKNVYHGKAIRLKASILSKIVKDKSSLQKFIAEDISEKAFLYRLIIDFEIYGNAFLERAGTPTSPIYYGTRAREIRVDEKGVLYQMGESLNSFDGVHYKNFSPLDKFYGEPSYFSAFNAITTNAQIDSFNNSFFANGARIDKAIIFENADPSEEQMKAFKKFFGDSYKGVDNSHKTLIISSNLGANGESSKVRIEDLSKIDDLSFEKLKLISRDEIIASHGVPPRLVGVMSAGSLGGGGELIGQLHSFNELEIKPRIEELESFFASLDIEVKLEGIDVTSFKDDAELVGSLVRDNIIDVREAKKLLGYV